MSLIPQNFVSPRSSTDEKVGGPVKNMGGPMKLLYNHV